MKICSIAFFFLLIWSASAGYVYQPGPSEGELVDLSAGYKVWLSAAAAEQTLSKYTFENGGFTLDEQSDSVDAALMKYPVWGTNIMTGATPGEYYVGDFAVRYLKSGFVPATWTNYSEGTIMARVRSVDDGGNTHRIFYVHNAAATTLLYFQLQYGAGHDRPLVLCKINGVDQWQMRTTNIDVLDPFGTNWFHIALVFSNGFAQFYLNGKPEASGYNITTATNKWIADLMADAAPPTIIEWGSSAVTNPRSLDDCAMYDRALTPTEITNNYSGPYNTTGLVLHLAMSNEDDTVTLDLADLATNNLFLNLDGVSAPLLVVDADGNHWWKFDGANDYIYTNESYSVPASNDFSLLLWVNASDTDGASNYGVISLMDNGTNVFFLRLGGTANVVLGGTNFNQLIRMCGQDAGAVCTTSESNTITDADIGIWRHIAITYDHSETNTLIYKDAVSQTIRQDMFSVDISSHDSLYIGRRTDVPVYYYGGIDDVRLYPAALTQAEITEIFNLDRE